MKEEIQAEVERVMDEANKKLIQVTEEPVIGSVLVEVSQSFMRKPSSGSGDLLGKAGLMLIGDAVGSAEISHPDGLFSVEVILLPMSRLRLSVDWLFKIQLEKRFIERGTRALNRVFTMYRMKLEAE